ncbi:alcohol dehydrogenase catalytic domain-containing protein [Desulfopila sp. IMCC35008]|uniref:zinc-binding dehydrogenase n=1 Tax=Desulfopila sp. IMCC35008 TaxID=2653858 RepID=UPI0013D6FAA4|nr:alcohol dehydrogenase catalytic domain-containing protein [Desulfopila sp. IMCC35008]
MIHARQLRLVGEKQLRLVSVSELPPLPAGFRRLEVLYCAICRTDGKMWKSGHRDLILPRVPGHEIAAQDPVTGHLFTIWPGHNCGLCQACLSGRDNLCDSMKITGFHTDGGFSTYIDAADSSLIPAGHMEDARLLCFAEPVACVLNCLNRIDLQKGERVVIHGGGVVGLITALACSTREVKVTVVEKNELKRKQTTPFCMVNGIDTVKNVTDNGFDIAINCCDAIQAFRNCIQQLRKGGRLGFFSGLQKTHTLDTDTLNLLHYHEIALFGTYGPRRTHMVEAVDFCRSHGKKLELLLEKTLKPEEVPAVMEKVADGMALKYLIDFSRLRKEEEQSQEEFKL